MHPIIQRAMDDHSCNTAREKVI